MYNRSAQLTRFCCLFLAILTLGACAPARPPVPPGIIPAQGEVSAADEKYGHEVMASLAQRYSLEQSDEKVDRVRRVADKLSGVSGSGGNPWHVYVFHDDAVKNAAATKGNYVFVWSGMLEAAHNDDELAAVLAHEIGHVLGGHTSPTPAEETREIISGLAGAAAGSAASYANYGGTAARLIEMAVSESIKALIVNPENQRKEYEADQIGLFLLADAGYDPEKAIAFWERATYDPVLAGSQIEFLSSHPSSESRFENLKKLLPDAKQRYSQALARGGQPAPEREAASAAISPLQPDPPSGAFRSPGESWIVVDNWATVHSSPDPASRALIDLPRSTEVAVLEQKRGWLKIAQPVNGFIEGRHLTPR